MYEQLVRQLNDRTVDIRLKSLRQLVAAVKTGMLDKPVSGDDVNNHIHTTYSFSPYSPTRAIWEAYRAGLTSAGIMDHESICGAREFIEAGTIVGIATTIGIECRTDFSATIFKGKRINNPDQLGNGYIALHGIPHQHIDAFKAYFEPLIASRQERNRRMTDRINDLFTLYNIAIDYDRDIVPISYCSDGGTVTERHILFALARHLIENIGPGEPLIAFLRKFDITLNASAIKGLQDIDNRFYDYWLLGLLKKELVGAFYIDATSECPDVRDVLAFAKQHNCIAAYAYLGDVTASITGDKKDQKFEDDHLDELIDLVKALGFEAITYMPSRNSPAQVARIMDLCERNGFLQISGEDINSPTQPFVCSAMQKKEFSHLVDATWALIGHESEATRDIANSFFSDTTISTYPDLNERIQVFKKIGLETINPEMSRTYLIKTGQC